MGEARRRQVQRAAADAASNKVDFAMVASAVTRLCRATSGELGRDCLTQAVLAAELLKRLGVESEVRVGFAAWRVGDGDGDVVSHIPNPNYKPRHAREAMYHAWLEVGNQIFDVTTAQLAEKAKALDALDGGTTDVQWAPQFLLIPFGEVSSYQEVAQGLKGLVFYKADENLKTMVLQGFQPPDSQDFANLWMVYEAPDANVIGPNHLR
ncbi:lasso peptide biosynthesis protein [Achromobacter denitrificans]|jgi:O6-methylguanine-DNA--protein-cysteine methyltransferase|uniref:lasso peptide biosynthesis protein n=1 Tax=Achromobacter sp. 2789STDY5608633 TaxID=1806501 RepID=UPI0006C868F0|nr:lasso peptide biosynthesis protein [Achromobacter sp. 2789STDY5608633]